ncbi:hypothetical protein, partial [Proteus mirabilis]|uniref:hypothetical protein n=1 Tax=Proteus mirabilis TaxID=584 RepID=UPI0013D2BF08
VDYGLTVFKKTKDARLFEWNLYRAVEPSVELPLNNTPDAFHGAQGIVFSYCCGGPIWVLAGQDIAGPRLRLSDKDELKVIGIADDLRI